jgi:hypothetical protein
MRTLDFENADLFENNRITIEGAKTVLWTLLAAIYEDELIEEPLRRETLRGEKDILRLTPLALIFNSDLSSKIRYYY